MRPTRGPEVADIWPTSIDVRDGGPSLHMPATLPPTATSPVSRACAPAAPAEADSSIAAARQTDLIMPPFRLGPRPSSGSGRRLFAEAGVRRQGHDDAADIV